MKGIYKITNPNGLVYIGQSIDIEKRFSYYKKYKCKSQTKLYNSLVKYGPQSHVFEVLIECSIDELNKNEKKFILEYNSFENGLNLTTGGDGFIMSEDTKMKMSLNMTGKKLSNSHRIAISNGNKGVKKNITDEHRIELSNRSRLYNKGRIKSKEEIEKIRASKVGRKRPEWLKKHLSVIRSKPFAIINDWVQIEFDSVTNACEYLRCSRKEISKAMKNNCIYKEFKLMYL